ncbi:ring finger domain-containing protein [Hirsutella rhossiliensis]|uniref:Ring finger domain-containing protein n=1 Tax=Hirsutella rhossiliensis TaxID=111463 RepID=A0A9P8MQT7_9HYPO|nr:ring finger domain-containing protein [Hirsutella rhossiliensis]KAH0958784.1 ring finger domain-containing protein [Hirsutella rhossiliensis]
MATQYEVEHNVELSEPRRPTRRVDMAPFFALLNMLSSPSGRDSPHNNPHATPTPVDTAALFRLLQDQLHTLHSTAPTPDNRAFLEQLMASLDDDIHDPPAHLRGVSQEFVDTLDRVGRKTLARDDDCAICKVPYLDDEWCLVVELPCKGRHRFDLECVGPWLRSKGTCPMCREDMGSRKRSPVPAAADDEEDDADMMYA